MTLAPLLAFRQKMSACPSPSKSPSPATYHPPLTRANACAVAWLAAYQMAFAPVLTLLQRTSDLPSPFRSFAGRAACATGTMPKQPSDANTTPRLRMLFIDRLLLSHGVQRTASGIN